MRVSTLSEAILNRVGAEKIASRVKKPLKELRLVCYYGCLMTRPPEVTGGSTPRTPQSWMR